MERRYLEATCYRRFRVTRDIHRDRPSMLSDTYHFERVGASTLNSNVALPFVSKAYDLNDPSRVTRRPWIFIRISIYARNHTGRYVLNSASLYAYEPADLFSKLVFQPLFDFRKTQGIPELATTWSWMKCRNRHGILLSNMLQFKRRKPRRYLRSCCNISSTTIQTDPTTLQPKATTILGV